MGWTGAISLAAGIVGLIALVLKWKMFPNKIRKEEDETKAIDASAITEAIDKRDIKALNEINRKNQT